MVIYKSDGSECTTEKRGLKLRLADVFREPGETASDFMKGQLGLLTEKDLADFRGWFEEAGYPCL